MENSIGNIPAKSTLETNPNRTVPEALVERFRLRFRGSTLSRGIFDPHKTNPHSHLESEALVAHFRDHLLGHLGIGIVPVNAQGQCWFGAIDIDIDTIDHIELYRKVRKYGMPLTVCRSRSGAAHLYLFMDEPRPAALVIAALKHWTEVLGYPTAEIFPKQERAGYRDDDGKPYMGNFINLPYFDAEYGNRYAFGPSQDEPDQIGALTLEEFTDSIQPWDGEDRITAMPEAPVRFETYGPIIIPAPPARASSGPLQFAAGTRNMELHRYFFKLRVRHGYSDELLREVAPILNTHLTGNNPLPPSELSNIVGSVLKHPAGRFEPVWPKIAPAAFQGLAGTIVRTIEPYTEADPVAILAQLLATFGNLINRRAHYLVGPTEHYSNIYVGIVGATSSGRKGSGLDHVKRLAKEVEPSYIANNFFSGIGSGEGIVWSVRDPQPPKGKKEPDPGIADKRLMVVETELSSLLQVTKREGTTVSAVLRAAWDNGNLQITNKNSPARATNAHVSIIGHITMEELRRNLTDTEKANGFANRFLWVLSRRSKLLPEVPPLPTSDFRNLVVSLKVAVDRACTIDEVRRDQAARELWHEMYQVLSNELDTGLVGAVTGRAVAQVVRLSLLYALFDRCSVITREHMEAAAAFWAYCEQSARCIFGNTIGDPLADQLLGELRRYPEGLTRADISNTLGRHQKSDVIERALQSLSNRGLARFEVEKTTGRSAERWFAILPTIAPMPPATETEPPIEPVKGEQVPLGDSAGPS